MSQHEINSVSSTLLHLSGVTDTGLRLYRPKHKRIQGDKCNSMPAQTALMSKTSHECENESESESERYLFDPHKKLIQSNNEKQLGSGDPY